MSEPGVKGIDVFLLPFGSFLDSEPIETLLKFRKENFLLPFGSFLYMLFHKVYDDEASIAFYSLLGVSGRYWVEGMVSRVSRYFLLPFGSFKGLVNMIGDFEVIIEPAFYSLLGVSIYGYRFANDTNLDLLSTPFWEFLAETIAP